MRGLEQIPWCYDLFMAWAERGRLRRWRDWLTGGAVGPVLEVGCGTGRNLPRLPAGARPVGTDPCHEVLLRARRRAPNVPLVRARAEALPFRDGAFRTVLSGMALCSVSDPAAALAEIRRVLAPGGALRALEHVRARRAGLARLQDLVQPGWTAFTGGCHPNRDTEAAVAAAGFRMEEDGRRERGVWRRFSARRK
jgi:ubiquinone/menaquinone biosynthesis C-methylase UbiE